MKALRWLSTQSYGSIYVNFGDLISVRQYVDQERLAGAGAFTNGVQRIALESVLQHQKHLIVPIFPLIATIILSKVRQILSGTQSCKFINCLIHFRFPEKKISYPSVN